MRDVAGSVHVCCLSGAGVTMCCHRPFNDHEMDHDLEV